MSLMPPLISIRSIRPDEDCGRGQQASLSVIIHGPVKLLSAASLVGSRILALLAPSPTNRRQ